MHWPVIAVLSAEFMDGQGALCYELHYNLHVTGYYLTWAWHGRAHMKTQPSLLHQMLLSLSWQALEPEHAKVACSRGYIYLAKSLPG
jgi:hypothetical protein